MTTTIIDDQVSINSVACSDVAALRSTRLAWLVVLVAASFFFYEFIQLNMFNAISFSLMKAFSINAEQLGRLSSFYLIANVIFLFPAGMLLDRCATRRVILTSLSICVIGTVMLALSQEIYWAMISRFLTGIGSAFCFLSVIRLASRWFPAHKMAFVTGIVVTMAMLGGMVAQAPMTVLVESVGWRHALLLDAALGVVILSAIFFIVQDYPNKLSQAHYQEQQVIQNLGYWKSIRLAFLRKQNWLAGLYTCLMNLPLGVLGGLWGGLYLVDAHGLSKLDASYISSMLFMGTIFGAPIAGWISDRLGRRRFPMMIGGILSLGFIVAVLLTQHLAYYPLLILFLLIGFVTSTQVISYPYVAETSPRIITAMSVSVVNISVQGGSALFQPVFGYLMDKHLYERTHQLSAHFLASDFAWAMLLFPIGFILAIIMTAFLRETRCKA